MSEIKYFSDSLNIQGKTIIIRLDLNVPLSGTEIQDYTRITLSLPFLKDLIKRKSKIIILDKTTNGQATTCLKAEKLLKKDDTLTIGACDNGMHYSQKKVDNKIDKSDLVIWTFKSNKIVSKNPNMYGYIKTKKPDNAILVSCKKTISKFPGNDHTIIGAFSFKKAETFLKYTKVLIKKNERINKEFYLDSVANLCISSGLKVKVNLVKKYIGWGTPKDFMDYKKIKF